MRMLQPAADDQTADQPNNKTPRTSTEHSSPGMAGPEEATEAEQPVNIYEMPAEQHPEPLARVQTTAIQSAQQEAEQQAQQDATRGIIVPANIRCVKDQGQQLSLTQPDSDIDDSYLLLASVVNQASWDAVLVHLRRVYILQMTVGKKHPVKTKAVVDLLNRFGSEPPNVYLAFALPAERYFTWTKQAWVTVRHETAKVLPASIKRIRQMALLVDNAQLRRRTEDL